MTDPQEQPAPDALQISHNGEIVHLGPVAFERYLAHISRVCDYAARWTKMAGGGQNSYACMRAFAPHIERFARSVELMMYRHQHSRVPDITLDLRDGGFPKFSEFMELESDLRRAPDFLAQGDNRAALRELISHELSEGRDPVDFVWALARRTYFRRLVEEAQFLPFNMGAIERLGESGERRRGSAVWSQMCSASSLPIFCYLDFEWSGERWLGDDAAQQDMLAETVRVETKSIRDICLLARTIDRAMPKLHPKELRRFTIGPVRSPVFSCERHPLIEALGSRAEDFVIEMKLEGVLSSGEYQESVGFLKSLTGQPQVLQSYSIDGVAGAKDTVFVRNLALMPHWLSQQLAAADANASGYGMVNMVTYDEAGAIYDLTSSPEEKK